MKKLTHTTDAGKADMVDVSGKPQQERTAIASGHITLAKSTLELIRENKIKKGRCPYGLGNRRDPGREEDLRSDPLVPPADDLKDQCNGHHGCNGRLRREFREMHRPDRDRDGGADSSFHRAATVYDMCKAVDKGMVIDRISLISKEKK